MFFSSCFPSGRHSLRQRHRVLSELNEPDKRYGATPLYYACQRGQVDEVKRLLRFSHIDVNTVVPVTAVSRLLVDDSRAPSSEYRAPLHIACARGYVDIVRLLLRHPEIDVNLTVSKVTPLKAAVVNGQLEVVRLLLEDPCVDVNDRDAQGNTVVHHCCLHGAHHMLKVLAEHGGGRLHLDAVNANGVTPFMMAVGAGETQLAKELLHFLKHGEWPLNSYCEC